MSVWGCLSVLTSLASAIAAIAKDSSKVFATLALCISILSFFFYVQ
jgi:hypothetical protein